MLCLQKRIKVGPEGKFPEMSQKVKEEPVDKLFREEPVDRCSKMGQKVRNSGLGQKDRYSNQIFKFSRSSGEAKGPL